MVGIDVNGSAAHVAVSHHATGKADGVIAGQVLNGIDVVARRGVGVSDVDRSGSKRIGQGKGHDSPYYRNAGNGICSAAGCHGKGGGGR